MEYEYWIIWIGGGEGILWTVVIGAVIAACVSVYLHNSQWRTVGRQRRKLTRQGINGPPPSWLHGNAPDLHRITTQSKSKSKTSSESESDSKGIITHDFVATLFPYLHQWAKEYGRVYTYTLRNKQNLYVGSPELVREMNQNMSTDLGKPTHLTKQLFPLFGNGILRSNGPVWTRQRKIIAPEFYMDKIKAMVGLMTDASDLVLSKWDDAIEAAQGNPMEVRVDEDLRSFSADVIARACFGSSYAIGKDIFSKLRSIQKSLSSDGFLFNSSKFTFTLTKSDKEREIEQRQKEVDTLIWDTVQERVRNNTSPDDAHKDLMQLLLGGALQSHTSDDSAIKDFVIDNCKNIYFAGHETTAVSSAWCLVLLSLYPDWQRRLRQEVHHVFKDAQLPPSFDALNKMKWLSMFIQEALRLYSPGAFVTREALKDVQLGDLLVPKGVLIWTLIPALHRDPEMWGPDAHEFKPERFAGGVANACKVPQAYIPFGVGPRNCLGKNFAMLELKLLLCSILPRFSFSLSPNYQHSPAFSMVVEPANGVYLSMSKIG